MIGLGLGRLIEVIRDERQLRLDRLEGRIRGAIGESRDDLGHVEDALIVERFEERGARGAGPGDV